MPQYKMTVKGVGYKILSFQLRYTSSLMLSTRNMLYPFS